MQETEPSQDRSAVGPLSARILKLMSIFSGLQMLSIGCSIIKMKLVALWLGASGVGLFGIYQSVLDTIATFTDMGIRQSSVRDVASQSRKQNKLSTIVRVVRHWSLYAGLLGATVMAILAIPLGQWFFGDTSGCWGFLILSVAMMLNSMSGGEQALLQGSARLKDMASANLWGTLIGLIVSIPLFYWCGSRGVVLSILAYAVTLFTALYIKRVRISSPAKTEPLGLRQIWEHGKGFVRLGLCMAIATFITSLAHTLFVGILNGMTSTAEVGLVQAGDTLVVRYIGMIFVAIGMEFYPRVAANHDRKERIRVFVNHEITLLMLILMPLLLVFLLIRGPVVELLYSREFMTIIPFVSWAALSSIPKAVSWCMAYTIVAKGDGKIYILTEGLDALISVPLCLLAYHLWGLTGLGMAYIVWYLLYMILTGAVYYHRYHLRLSGRCLRLCSLSFLLTICFLIVMESIPIWCMCIIATLIVLPCIHALHKLVTHRR